MSAVIVLCLSAVSVWCAVLVCCVCVMCLRAGVQVWVLDTRFMMWGEAKTLGKPPQARISHTFTLVSSAEEAAGTAGYDVPLAKSLANRCDACARIVGAGLWECACVTSVATPVSLVWPRLCH